MTPEDKKAERKRKEDAKWKRQVKGMLTEGKEQSIGDLKEMLANI